MKYLVSLSGGKDSTACILWALNNLKKDDLIFYFIDTKWEHEAVYVYLDYLEKELDIKITIVESEGMLALCKRYKFMPNRIMRFCTKELKIKPAIKFYYEEFISKGIDFINIVGIRREESKARANTQPFEVKQERYNKNIFEVKSLYPIVFWNTQEVFEYHKKNGVKVNPLYKKGFSRVGCYPCIFARKSELVGMEDKYKNRLRNLEEEMSELLGKKVNFFSPDRDKFLNQKILNIDIGCVNQYGICE